MGTVRQGIVTKDLVTGETVYANTSTGMANNTVLAVCFDNFGNAWIGLDKGISYVLINSPYMSLLGKDNDIGTGYASVNFNGQLYLGTNQGLYVMPTVAGLASTAISPVAISGVSGQIWNLFVDGDMMLCAADKGAFVLKNVGGRNVVTKIEGLAGTWNFRSVPGNDNLIVACDYDGFCVLEKKGATYQLRNRIKGTDVSSGNFEFDSDGSLWVAHWTKGVYRFALSSDLMSVAQRDFFGKDHGLYVDGENVVNKMAGRVVVASADGMHRYDLKAKKLVVDKRLSDVFARYGKGYQLYESKNGDIWGTSSDFIGIAHANGRKGYSVDTTSLYGIHSQLQLVSDRSVG